MARGERKTSGQQSSRDSKQASSGQKRTPAKPKSRRSPAAKTSAARKPSARKPKRATRRGLTLDIEAAANDAEAAAGAGPRPADTMRASSSVAHADACPNAGALAERPLSQPSRDQIAARAYFLWIETGASAEANWLRAEAELTAESQRAAHP